MLETQKDGRKHFSLLFIHVSFKNINIKLYKDRFQLSDKQITIRKTDTLKDRMIHSKTENYTVKQTDAL